MTIASNYDTITNMNEDIEQRIIREMHRKGSIKTSDIVEATGLARQSVHRVLKRLVDRGDLVKVGDTKGAKYMSRESAMKGADPMRIRRSFANRDLHEDLILRQLRDQTTILQGVKPNVVKIVEYAFTEMVNNAISHSDSAKVTVEMESLDGAIRFVVKDYGIGIFNNLIEKYGLEDKYAAIQELLKGKTTTKPDRHTGEGVFFTSKVADTFHIESSGLRLTVDNSLDDVFVENIKDNRRGTRIVFDISKGSNRELSNIFRKYTEGDLAFSKTEIKVKLYKLGISYVSRSEAKRVVQNLDRFKSVVFDFAKVDTVGQAFADEIFRVFTNEHPAISIRHINANENVEFMIQRAIAGRTQPGLL